MRCIDGVERNPTLSSDGRYRYPRLRTKLPRGYDKLTKRQKKLAMLIISGMSVSEACRQMSIDTDSFYRWRREHPGFREFYYTLARKSAQMIESKLDACLPRAAQVVEDALESPDPYFAYDAAMDILKGRGKLSSTVKEDKTIHAHVSGELLETHVHKLDDSQIGMLVQALINMGGKTTEDKVIEATIVKELPSGDSQV